MADEAGRRGRLAVIAAGGTGGHLFPAEALARVLIERGWEIVLATDERVSALAESFPARQRIALSSATFRPGDVAGMARAATRIVRGVMEAHAAYRRIEPAVVVGFGGYPSAPALVAALLGRRPTVIHEQNAVLGRANRRLAPHIRAIACAFPSLANAPASVRARAVVVGNPVRPQIRALADLAYAPPGEEIRLLITGGSQGARLISELVPAAMAELPAVLRERLRIHQQTRPESMEAARRSYDGAAVQAQIAPFFADIAALLASAHLVIGRAGASTVSELAVTGRPAILIPLGIALDDDQGRNAQVLAAAGAAEVMLERGLTRQDLTAALQRLLTTPGRLEAMAAAARSLARPDAAERLADIVEATAG